MVNKARLKGILGIALIIIVLAFGYAWENYGRQFITYTEVVTLAESAPKNVVIDEDMLEIIRIEKSSLIDGVITKDNVKSIIGTETTTYIPAGTQLVSEYFCDSSLALGKDRYTFKIPEEWIYSYPQTLRRGDTIYIYPIYCPDEYDMFLGTETIFDERKPIANAKVAYVKDSSNREVVDTVSEQRYDGSATVAQIEIICSENLYNTLTTVFESGYKFNILYE